MTARPSDSQDDQRVKEYESRFPILALGFSNSHFFSDPAFDNSLSTFLATGSFKAGQNQVEVIKMNEQAGMGGVLTL